MVEYSDELRWFVMNEVFEQINEQICTISGWEYASLQAGLTTRNGGVSIDVYASLNVGLHVNDNSEHVIKNRHLVAMDTNIPLSNWVFADQIHDKRIIQVCKDDIGKGTESYNTAIVQTDGLFTMDKNIMLSLCFADCVPLYFIAPSHRMIGIAHAGWKGTVLNIGANMIQKWEQFGISSKDIHVAIGPSISDCCYVVDDYVIEKIKKLPQTNAYKEISIGQYALNLKRLNQELLLQANIPKENISVSKFCTSCTSQFFSHRRDGGKTGRMMGFIGWRD